jgi:hemolysin activation/secretion protein
VERAPCALDQSGDIRFTLRSVEFGGLRGLAADALRPAFEPFVGADQPISVICEIRDRAATILRDAGYVAAVEIPEQRISAGTVRFEVLLAKLVAVRVRGDAGRAERTIARYLERLQGREVFNRDEAERYLLLAGDLPGYDVRLALRSAGAGRGEVIGEVTVVRTPAILEANVQNFGSNELGRWGGMVRGEAYGLTGLGDRTVIALFSTADLSEQQTLQIGHDMRVGGEGLTLAGRFTYAWANPELTDPTLDVEARTLLATVEASYPLLRTQSASAWAAAGLDLIDQDVRINGLPLSRDRLRVAFVRLDLEGADRASFGRAGGYSAAEPRLRAAASLELRKGLGLFGASEDCGPAFARCTAPGAVPPSRLEGDAAAAVVRFQGSFEYRAVPALTAALGLRAQYSGRPLLSFEEFSAGNYTAGRGYDPGTLLGDNGVGIQAELRYGSLVPSAPRDAAVQPFVFFDLARVSNEDRAFPVAGGKRLSSVGGGVRAAFGQGATLEVSLAVPLERAGLLAKKPDPRLLVSLTTRLWPWSF